MEDEDGDVPPLRSRRRKVAIVLALAIVAALALLWSQRRTIATRFVDRRLAAAGVPARYTVADLAPGRQRLTDVVIGDPADPDLVADWIETRVGYGLGGAALEAVAAGRVRMRARLVDGRMSLGAIDRLLPAPSGAPFAFPALNADVADLRLRLETPAGVAGLRVAGRGRLDGGFAGTLAAVAPSLGRAGCAAERVTGSLHVRTLSATDLRLAGPLRVAAAHCGGATLLAVRADARATLTLGEADGSSIEARLVTGALTHEAGHAEAVQGAVRLARSARGAIDGRVVLAARRPVAAGVAAAGATLAGRVVRAPDGAVAFDGTAGVTGADLAARLPDLSGSAAGSPLAPLVDGLATAMRRAARDLSGRADLRATAGNAIDLAVRSARLASASGARATIVASGEEPALSWRGGAPVVAASLTLAGGGLPEARARIERNADGRLRGGATVAPYLAGGARLALAPVAIAADRGGLRIATLATLSGPLGSGGGRVEALALPIDLRRGPGGALRLNPGCTPIAWRSLAIGGLRLDPATLRLCGEGDALVRVVDGRASGGGTLAATRLGGRLGGSPLALTAAGGRLRLGERGFALDGVEARIGAPGRATRLTFGTLAGTIGQGVAGRFADGGGQIANVPLLLSGAAGDWRFDGRVLALGGAMRVSDAGAPARFRPMAARGMTLRLADGRIDAAGTLAEPTTGERVAEVRIGHALGSGTGAATLAVPALDFRPGFQPDLLTPLTFGVVADVRGRVTGDARIAWGDRVESTGSFATEALDLAAAFGPVTGIATRLRFTDLLGMVTAPGQVATVRTVNPGIPVEDGVVRYALEGPTLVRVDGARWPFAGGALTLAPTLLDFSADRERRMTFQVEGAGARAFLQQFDFDNIDATGTFDGRLPMVFGEAGGRIEDGHLAMRPGGGTIAYVGELGQEQLGFWGDLAFQALRSLRYRSLDVTLNGPLAGEMVTDVRFAGISQGAGARSGFLANFIGRRLQRLPFVFNIRIRAPFRGLLDSAASFYDPRRLVQRNLQQLLEEQNRRTAVPTPPAVQPPSSEDQR